MRFQLILGLLLCNVFWSGSYSVSKKLMETYQPLEVSFLRFLTAALPLLVWGFWGGTRSPLVKWGRNLARVDTRLFIVGALTFFVSPICQMTGLKLSRAVDSSLMIAMEPLFVILSACLMLGEKLTLRLIVSLALAITGGLILSDFSVAKLGEGVTANVRLLGNFIFALSGFSEAAYSTVAKPALDRRSPQLFLSVALLTGIALLFAANMLLGDPTRIAGLVPLFERAKPSEFLAFAYLGFACTVFSYLYWMHVVQDAPVSVMALTLYLQPVLGMIWGNVFLGEVLSQSTFLGAGLIFFGVLVGTVTIKPLRKKKKA